MIDTCRGHSRLTQDMPLWLADYFRAENNQDKKTQKEEQEKLSRMKGRKSKRNVMTVLGSCGTNSSEY